MGSPFLASAIPNSPEAFTGSWTGTIAQTVTDMDEPAYVIVPAFADDLRLGPYRWQSRDSTSKPQKGDACLVTFDNDGVGWITAWWPFG